MHICIYLPHIYLSHNDPCTTFMLITLRLYIHISEYHSIIYCKTFTTRPMNNTKRQFHFKNNSQSAYYNCHFTSDTIGKILPLCNLHTKQECFCFLLQCNNTVYLCVKCTCILNLYLKKRKTQINTYIHVLHTFHCTSDTSSINISFCIKNKTIGCESHYFMFTVIFG